MFRPSYQPLAWRSNAFDFLTLISGKQTPQNRTYILSLGYPYGDTTISLYPRKK